MIIQSIAGLLAFVLIAWIISENRRKVDLRVVATCRHCSFTGKFFRLW